MKNFLTNWLLCIACVSLVGCDMVSDFIQKQASLKSQIDASTEKKAVPKSNLDIEGFLNLSKSFESSKSTKEVKKVPLEDVAQRSIPTPTHQNNDLNLATITRNRRLNQENHLDIPDSSVLEKLQNNIDNLSKSTHDSPIDSDLFSTDVPLVVDNTLEIDLQKKISAMSQSLQKLKIAKQKYLRSMDIEDQNRELFTEAQKKISLDLEAYRQKLYFMKSQANSLKNEKNVQVLELENLINQRNVKQKQIRDLMKKNEIINVQYTLVNKQIDEITNYDKMTEAEISQLTLNGDKLKNEYSDLEHQYLLLNMSKQKLSQQFNNTLNHRSELIGELEELKTKIKAEEPVNQQLTQTSLELMQQNSDLELRINKYDNEIGTLHKQLKNLEEMKTRARQHLDNFATKQQEVLSLKEKIQTANEQVLKKQAELEKFERELIDKESSCRCTKKQLMQIMSDKQMASNNQQAISGLLDSVETSAPKPANMKLLNNLMFNNTAVAAQPKLDFLNDPYFKQTAYFKSD